MKYLSVFLSIIALVLFWGVVRERQLPKTNQPRFIATFSASQARYLGLDAQTAYTKILQELKPSEVRLQADWDTIEPIAGQYNWQELDGFINQAAQQNIKVTLAVGRKLPRWPECHDPDWIKGLSFDEIKEDQLSMLRQVVNHYKDNPTIVRWQVENEPLFSFGVCPPPNWHTLVEEVALVKSLDKTRPILLTDSGELSSWWETAGLADEQGVTLYRVTWNALTGYFSYPLPAYWYRLKAALISPWVKQTVVSELQLEPWAPQGLNKLDQAGVRQSLSLDKFWDNVNFFRRTGFNEGFVWGVEWWIKAEQLGMPQYWQAGKQLFIVN